MIHQYVNGDNDNGTIRSLCYTAKGVYVGKVRIKYDPKFVMIQFRGNEQLQTFYK